jgi:hypothetical protein
MAAIIVIAMAPLAAFPALLSTARAAHSDMLFIWLYPLYVATAGFLSWQCYGRRSEMTWILIFIMLLTHAAIWILAANNYS